MIRMFLLIGLLIAEVSFGASVSEPRRAASMFLYGKGADGVIYALLGNRATGSGWVNPGGLQDPEDAENMAVTAAREAKEETYEVVDIDAKVVAESPSHEVIFEKVRHYGRLQHEMFFVQEATDAMPASATINGKLGRRPEIDRFAWVPVQALLDHAKADNHFVKAKAMAGSAEEEFFIHPPFFANLKQNIEHLQKIVNGEIWTGKTEGTVASVPYWRDLRAAHKGAAAAAKLPKNAKVLTSFAELSPDDFKAGDMLLLDGDGVTFTERHRKFYLKDAALPALVKELQQLGVDCFGFTSRYRHGRRDALSKILSQYLNIHYKNSPSYISLNYFVLRKGGLPRSQAFADGIIFRAKDRDDDKGPKGPILKIFLDRAAEKDVKPARIFFVDNKVEHVVSVANTLTELGIEGTAYLYQPKG